MKRAAVLVLALMMGAGAARAQGLVSDVFSGKLINPEPGVFAWYDLIDKAAEKTYLLRQAIVGKEKVKLKTGYWLETELIPQVGFPTIYKMLLTGPASDPKHIHQIIVKEGEYPPEVVPVQPETAEGSEGEGEAGKQKQSERRESLGMETVKTPQGDLKAEHVVITRPKGAEGGEDRLEVWLNDSVRPMGIVRMVAPEGELLLRRFGKDGPDAQTAISGPPRQRGELPFPSERVDVRVEEKAPAGAER